MMTSLQLIGNLFAKCDLVYSSVIVQDPHCQPNTAIISALLSPTCEGARYVIAAFDHHHNHQHHQPPPPKTNHTSTIILFILSIAFISQSQQNRRC